MRTRFRRKAVWAPWVMPLIAVVCFSYFGFHAWHGSYGLDSAVALETRRLELSTELASLQERRERLEKRVSLLSDGTIEADMLDERSRAMLNLAREDEVVYFNGLN